MLRCVAAPRYDSDGGGELERSEILALVIASQEAAEHAQAAAQVAIHEIDQDGDGTLTMDEIVHAAQTNPKVRVPCNCRCSRAHTRMAGERLPFDGRTGDWLPG